MTGILTRISRQFDALRGWTVDTPLNMVTLQNLRDKAPPTPTITLLAASHSQAYKIYGRGSGPRAGRCRRVDPVARASQTTLIGPSDRAWM